MKRSLFAAFALALALSACESSPPSTSDVTAAYKIPDNMKDCTVAYMESPYRRDLYVVRCPLSATTTQWDVKSGKTTNTYSAACVDAPTTKEPR